MYQGTTYGDISPRVGIHAVGQFLAYAESNLCLEKFGKVTELPKNEGQIVKWRRPVPFPVSTVALQEGVTPSPQALVYEDVSVQIAQYGAYSGITDVIMDTHEDPALKTMVELHGKQAGDVKEAIIWGVVRAGTSVIYTGTAAARSSVNAVVTLDDIRAAVRELKANHAKKITKMLKASANIGTQSVNASYVLFSHTNMERDFREMPSFLAVNDYASGGPIHPMEIGSVEEVRIILTQHLEPFFGAGSTTTTGVLNNGTAVDVYPLVIIGEDAYGTVPLKGMSAANVMVANPKVSPQDPLAQRGTVGWKMWYAAKVLNELWMIRIESACTAL